MSLLGVYDLSLTNSYVAAGVGTPSVRANAAQASQLYNAQLAALEPVLRLLAKGKDKP